MPLQALVDAGPIIAYYSCSDAHHEQILSFFKTCCHRLITTDPCIAEAMYALYALGKYSGGAYQVQASLAADIAYEIWLREPLENADFVRIADLFDKYKNVPADFADLSLVAVSERLNISDIVTLDSDFDIYRRFQKNPQPFNRIFYPHTRSRKK